MSLSIVKRKRSSANDEYVTFEPRQYVDHPVVLSRLEAGLSQAQLAARMGISLAALCKIESNPLCSVEFICAVELDQAKA